MDLARDRPVQLVVGVTIHTDRHYVKAEVIIRMYTNNGEVDIVHVPQIDHPELTMDNDPDYEDFYSHGGVISSRRLISTTMRISLEGIAQKVNDACWTIWRKDVPNPDEEDEPDIT